MAPTDTDRVTQAIRLNGTTNAFEDAFDSGILRLYARKEGETRHVRPAALVGLVVIRGGRVTYAELDGRVHHFGRVTEHDIAMRLLIEQIFNRKRGGTP